MIVCVLAGAGYADSVPSTDPSYIQFNDMTTLNFRYLQEQGLITDPPATPSGTSVPLIRMFSNGNTNPSAVSIGPVKWQDLPDGELPSAAEAEFWFGLEYTNDLVTGVLTTDEVRTAIQTITGSPTADVPLFAFDQNQAGKDEKLDIALKGRVILVDPTVNLVPTDDADKLDAQEVTTTINDLIANHPTKVKVFTFDDTDVQVDSSTQIAIDALGTTSFPGGIFPNVAGTITENDFVLLPGDYDPIPGDVYGPVDNNIGGNVADWGGFISDLTLSSYDGWSFLVELQGNGDTNGPEEAYIVGALDGFITIPLPPAALAGGGLLLLVARRRRII